MADSKEINQLAEELKAAAGELRGNIGEFKSIKSKVEELKGQMAEIIGLKEAVALIESKMKAPGAPSVPSSPDASKAAFMEFIMKGKGAMSPEAVKSLQIGDDSKGGYLVPAEFRAEVIRRVFDFSPIRTVANIIPASRGEVQIPVESGDLGASWVGENESSGDTQSTYAVGLETITAYKMVGRVDVSNDLLDSSPVNIEAMLRDRAGEKFGRTEGTAFITGTGAKQPEGIMTNADVAAVAGGDASAIKVDGMLDLYGALKTAYDANARYIMNKKTMVAIRKLKDSNGLYYWQPALTAGLPETFNGVPILKCSDMVDIGANVYPVAYGDFRAGYSIADGMQMTVLRDDLTQSDYDLVRFRFKQRVGGQVVQPEAIKKMKIATSV